MSEFLRERYEEVDLTPGQGKITATVSIGLGVLALMGSTGRSTGPHVHFEVIRNGKSENPETYIKRASR